MTGTPPSLTWLRERAAQRAALGLRRELRPRSAGGAAIVDGAVVSGAGSEVDLASNDYLGLARHPVVVAAAAAAARTWGAGATGSRLVTGSTELHAELEDALAGFVGTEGALVFSSGYTANLGALVALSGPGSLIVSDAGNHASIVDACRLSRARVVVSPHRDVPAVAAALAGRAEERALVVTDAVFSVDGELAPLAELYAATRTHGALLVIDDAHGLGVLGPGGTGAARAAQLAGRPDVVVTVSLSKSLGSQGGAVLATREVIAHLVDSARTFIFDTGLAPACAGAALAALRLLTNDGRAPEQVRAHARALAAAAAAAGWTPLAPQPAAGVPGGVLDPAAGVPGGVLDPAAEPDHPPARSWPSTSALVSLPAASAWAALAAAEECRRLGVRVGCFRPPSVPDGRSRLRLSARATLTQADLERAAAALRAARRA